MTFKFLNIGDPHLNKLKKFFGKEKGLQIQIEAIDFTIRHAIEEGVNNIVVLGDIYDTPFPDQDDQVAWCRLIKKYEHMNWYVILGNHDISNNQDHSLKTVEMMADMALPSLKIFTKPKRVVINDIPVVFCPYPHTSRPDKSEKSSLIFAHQEYKGAKRDNGMVSKDGHSISDSSNYIISGHLHTWQDLGRLYYPGTLFQFNFGDVIDRSYTISTAEKRGKRVVVTNEKFTFDTPFKMITIPVESEIDLEKVPSKDDGNFYRLFLMNPEVVIPGSFRKDHPWVLDVSGKFKKKSKHIDEDVASITSDNEYASPSITIKKIIKASCSKQTRKGTLAQLRRSMKELGI